MISTCYILEWIWNLSLKRAFVEKAKEKGWHDIFCINEDLEGKKYAFYIHCRGISIKKLLVTQMSLLWIKTYLGAKGDIADELLFV